MRSIPAIRTLARRAGDILSPQVCHSCGTAIGHEGRDLCTLCWDELSKSISGDYCETCGADRGEFLLDEGRCTPCREKKAGRFRFDRFIRVGRYSGVLQQLILQFKHRFTLDDFLGGLLASAIQGAIDPREVSDWVPIPSPWRRRFRRGFQPTELLATRALADFGLRPSPLLTMRRHVPQLHAAGRLSVAQRVAAVAGAFRLSPGVDFCGKTIGIIDDVCTTGATLAEAARTIRQGGAGRIVAVVLAKWSSVEEGGAGVDPASASA